MVGAAGRGAGQAAVVIGGGVIGTCCALALQERGFAVTIFDPVSVRRAASWGNAGHIAVEQVEPLASLATVKSMPRRLFWRGGALGLPLRDIRTWLPFSLRLLAASRPKRFQSGKRALAGALSQAMAGWRRLLDKAGASGLLREEGHFIVWETGRSAAAGRAAWASSDLGSATVRDVTADEMRRLCGLVSAPLAGAVRFEGSGQIDDLGDLADALNARFEREGGRQDCRRVRALDLADGQARCMLDDGEVIAADLILVAAGVESRALLEPLGHKVPIIAERGYHIQSGASQWPRDLPPVVFEDRSMIVTRFRSGLRCASFVEFARSDSAPDPRKWMRLRRHSADLGLPLAEPVEQWIGARPTLPDYLPAIGRSDKASNLLYAFGHQHLGLTLAAVTGEAIGALAVGEEPAIDLAPFALKRF